MDEHADALYGYALVRVRDRRCAEDLVQETLLAALQARHRFLGLSSERTWLVGILKHKIADHFRKVGRVHVLDGGLPLPHAWRGHRRQDKGPVPWRAHPAEVFDRKEFWRVLRDCVEELPPRIARAFWMREVEGWSSTEVCRLMDISLANLWVMQHRARRQLRRSLELKGLR